MQRTARTPRLARAIPVVRTPRTPDRLDPHHISRGTVRRSITRPRPIDRAIPARPPPSSTSPIWGIAVVAAPPSDTHVDERRAVTERESPSAGPRIVEDVESPGVRTRVVINRSDPWPVIQQVP